MPTAANLVPLNTWPGGKRALGNVDNYCKNTHVHILTKKSANPVYRAMRRRVTVHAAPAASGLALHKQ